MKRHLRSSGAPFVFAPDKQASFEEAIKRYPEGRQKSAVMAGLHLAQEQQGWISEEVVDTIAARLEMPALRVWEVASFYTMYNLEPKGTYHLQVCTTTPCWLRGSDEVLKACHAKAKAHGASVFSVTEVECLGGCVNAPLVQINNDFYEDLTGETTATLLDQLAAGKSVKAGSMTGRCGSAPQGYAGEKAGGDHA